MIIGIYDLNNYEQRGKLIIDLIEEQPDNYNRKTILEDLYKIIDDIEEDYSGSKSEISELNDEIDEKETENNELQDEIDELTEKLSKLEDEIEELKNDDSN